MKLSSRHSFALLHNALRVHRKDDTPSSGIVAKHLSEDFIFVVQVVTDDDEWHHFAAMVFLKVGMRLEDSTDTSVSPSKGASCVRSLKRILG